ncbi:hypothetical protein WAI453_006469 [Rhynchosporium graminicola]
MVRHACPCWPLRRSRPGCETDGPNHPFLSRIAPHEAAGMAGVCGWLYGKGFQVGLAHHGWAVSIIEACSCLHHHTSRRAALIGYYSSKQKAPKVPNDILLAGLAVQSFVFVVFHVLLTIVTAGTCNTRKALEKMSSARSPFLGILAISSVLVFMRTLFRLIETSQGVFGHLSTHGGYFAGLEFVPVVIAVGLLAVWHPRALVNWEG